jgi:hypothetical protein
MLATEGVVSALYYRLVTNPAVQARREADAFYESFGAMTAEVDAIDNAYLKLFMAIRTGKYDAGRVLDAYRRLYQDEAPVLDALERDVFLGQKRTDAQIWLLNDDFSAGTTLFDQYRGLPRPQSFELNAASLGDLVGVPGVDRALASAILGNGPYDALDDLRRVPGMTESTLSNFRRMKAAMDAPVAAGTEAEGTISIRSILIPYARRAGFAWLACSLAAAFAYRALRRVRWWRLALNGILAALIGLLCGWTIDHGTGAMALAAPILVFGVPAMLTRAWRTRSVSEAALVLGAWALASVPAAVAVRPWF